MFWGTVADPEGTRNIRTMSVLETRTIPYLELFKIAEAIRIREGIGQFGDVLGYLKGPYDMQSIMSHHYIRNAGQLDFAVIVNGWPIAFEVVDAGKVLVNLNYVVENYGPETNIKVGVQVEKYCIPTVVFGISSHMKWYYQNADKIAKIEPGLISNEIFRMFQAMALLNLPKVKKAVEQEYPGLYDAFEGDTLKIALFLLGKDVKVPDFNWKIWKYTGKKKSFARCCRFTNSELIARTKATYGVMSTTVDINTKKYEIEIDPKNPKMKTWWKNREELHMLLAQGLSWTEVQKMPIYKKYAQAVRIFTRPM